MCRGLGLVYKGWEPVCRVPVYCTGSESLCVVPFSYCAGAGSICVGAHGDIFFIGGPMCRSLMGAVFRPGDPVSRLWAAVFYAGGYVLIPFYRRSKSDTSRCMPFQLRHNNERHRYNRMISCYSWDFL